MPASTTTTTFLITGASRGIGLAYAREILSTDDNARVIATAREPSTATHLQALVKEFEGRVQTLALDLADKESIRRAGENAAKLSLAEDGIDVLINNAAIFEGAFAGPLAPDFIDSLESNLLVNVTGTACLTEALLPLLHQGREKKVWSISTSMASLGHVPLSTLPLAASYSISEAALNMWMRKMAAALRDEGFTFINICPGQVKTELTQGRGEMEAHESASKGVAVLRSKTSADSGSFVNFAGETKPW